MSIFRVSRKRARISRKMNIFVFGQKDILLPIENTQAHSLTPKTRFLALKNVLGGLLIRGHTLFIII